MEDNYWSTIKKGYSQLYKLLLIYYPYIILALIVIYFLYYVFSYYYELKRRYNCMSLNNLLNGEINKCFNSQPEYCKDININLGWGWCQDPDYLGVYAGDINGPFGFSCDRWLTDTTKCPPIQCEGDYPIGLKTNTSKGQIQTYGWCSDIDINRALQGSLCGPSPEENIKCQNWIWDNKNCPQTCPININVKPSNQTIIKPIIEKPTIKAKCSILCGYQNGRNIPCPPPDCRTNNEKCLC